MYFPTTSIDFTVTRPIITAGETAAIVEAVNGIRVIAPDGTIALVSPATIGVPTEVLAGEVTWAHTPTVSGVWTYDITSTTKELYTIKISVVESDGTYGASNKLLA